ncbi:MAG: hypothetical protein JNL75_08790 [Chitinophagales bacterium]|nr:hypothetical protein [Chitinophagales bacterium]
MRKVKVTCVLIALIYTINSNAQWNPLGPTTTNSDINIGGTQFGRMHIRYNIQPPMMMSESNPSNGHQNVLSLSKELGTSLGSGGWQSPAVTITSIPTWGFAIDNDDRRLRFTYTDLINQPSTNWIWNGSTAVQITSWPNVREVFSINTDKVESFSNMFVSRWLGNGGNLTIEGEFRVRDINGKNQFLVDNTGFVRAREIKVDMQVIPDYVFKSGYKLMTLRDLEKYIAIHKHLPNIKGENEFNEKEGIGLGEMNMKLLEKVEELTLYIIQQQKEIDEIKKSLINVKNQ